MARLGSKTTLFPGAPVRFGQAIKQVFAKNTNAQGSTLQLLMTGVVVKVADLVTMRLKSSVLQGQKPYNIWTQKPSCP